MDQAPGLTGRAPATTGPGKLTQLSRSGGAALPVTETFDVFFSYNRKDQETVRAVRDALEARDVRVWMDEHQIDPGDRWMQEIQNNIAAAPAAIFLGLHDPGLYPSPSKAQADDVAEYDEL
ncbi:MAG TPA: toll/interleukin-1 receptor domain-containing protein [Thermoanaerobaculia bacterium]|nr:toll/interleukin-1 receptor domain-containing protein [Thermoanaerobaculia bacterium]